MDISVIIPTYNNCNRLNITLMAFTELEIPFDITWELIVVDNNSSDCTKDVIFKFNNTLPSKYVFEQKQGISHARNAGLCKATGKLIVFTDDDVKPCKYWLELYWREYQLNPQGFFWGGPVESEFEATPIDMGLIQIGPASVKGLDWGKDKKYLAPGEYFVSANWATPSDVLKEVGLFNVEMGLNASTCVVLVGEETDLMNRLQSKGLKPIYLPNVTIKHFVPTAKMTIQHIASRAEASGRFFAEKAIESKTVSIYGVPRWIHRKLVVSLFKAKIKYIFKRNWYIDYIEYRRLVGCIKQLRENRYVFRKSVKD